MSPTIDDARAPLRAQPFGRLLDAGQRHGFVRGGVVSCAAEAACRCEVCTLAGDGRTPCAIAQGTIARPGPPRRSGDARAQRAGSATATAGSDGSPSASAPDA